MQRKLNKLNLNNGSILLPNNNDTFLSLSNHELTQPQKDFLILGPSSHLFKRFNHVQKQTEIEILYQNVLKLQEQNQVKTKSLLRDLLKDEATKNRSNKKHKNSTLLTRQLKKCCRTIT